MGYKKPKNKLEGILIDRYGSREKARKGLGISRPTFDKYVTNPPCFGNDNVRDKICFDLKIKLGVLYDLIEFAIAENNGKKTE